MVRCKVEQLVPPGLVDAVGVGAEGGCVPGDRGEGLHGVGQPGGGCGSSGEPGGVGVGGVEDLVVLGDLLAEVRVESVGSGGQGAELAFADPEAVEVLLLRRSFRMDAHDGGFRLLDGPVGVDGAALGAAPVAYPRGTGVVVCFPLGWSQDGVQLVLEVLDGSGVGLPRRSGAVEGGFEVVELLGCGCLPVLSVGEVVDELPAVVVERC